MYVLLEKMKSENWKKKNLETLSSKPSEIIYQSQKSL